MSQNSASQDSQDNAIQAQLSSLTQIVDADVLSTEQLLPIAQLCTYSTYVSRICHQYPAAISFIADNARCPVFEHDIEALQTYFNAVIGEYTDSAKDEHELLRNIRIARHLLLSTITYRDIVLDQPIEQSLTQVSVLADSLINCAYQYHYAHFCERYGVPQGSDGPLPMCILGMGKLGGHELNFSSDIDLIFAYPEKGVTTGGRKSIEYHQFFTKLAQKLIHTLDTTTADGFVYRVDMRLRPFGESGPLVANFSALEDYYQDQGREWERYAMLKARVINPDNHYSSQLMQVLRPFVYRRYVDFTALDSLRSMKQLIEKEVRRKQLTNNIKLGAGGIREIEFFVQSMQLIHAGKHRVLQTPSLCKAVTGLVDCELIKGKEAQQLMADYRFLRKVEHCLQQFDDEQTQTLPDEPSLRIKLAQALNHDSWGSLFEAITTCLNRVNLRFSNLIESPDDNVDETDPLYVVCDDLWSIESDQNTWQTTLSPYYNGELIDLLRTYTDNLKEKLSRLPIGQRGTTSLNALIPSFLYDVISQQHSPASIIHITPVITSIVGRTAYLDLLRENQQARTQLLTLTAKSEWISAQIARFPLLLDELLSPTYLSRQLTDFASIHTDLAQQLQQTMLRIDPDDLEAMMNVWRQFKLSQQLIIAAADVSNTLATNKVSDHLTALADVILDSVAQSAWRDMVKRYGCPADTSETSPHFVIIAYGKFGGFEMGYGSDLDIVCLHNVERSVNTTGPKPVSASQFYAKLVQRIMHLMSTSMQLGKVYEIDLRLRPNGNSGLLASHIDSFSDYQRSEAWTWEHQALVRARPVWGDPTLMERFIDIRAAQLSQPRDIDQLKQDVTDMRQKMRDHLLKEAPGSVDLKQSIGGITDIEFLVQYWVLGYAKQFPKLNDWPDNLRILDSAEAVGLVDSQTRNKLQHAYLTMRQAIHESSLHDSELSPDTDELLALRDYVSGVWQTVLG